MGRMFFGFGLIQLVLVLATIYVANERNRNPFLWGVAAVFMPIIALVIVGLLDPVPPVPPVPPLSSSPGARPTLAVCSGCGRIAPDPTARFCSACGTTLPPVL